MFVRVFKCVLEHQGSKKIISSSRSAALSKINLKDWTVKIKIWNKMLVLNVLGYIIFSLEYT
jgi:hypothetical protein